MRRQSVRVVVASEFPRVRDLLAEMVEREGGVTIGQTQDATRTLALVRNGRPDVVIVDCFLPYVSSPETPPLCRTGGLDIAEVINRESPGTEVVLLNNLEAATDRAVISRDGLDYSLRIIENDLPLAIRSLRRREATPGNMVYARIETETKPLPPPLPTNPFDVIIFSGVCALALGWGLVISMISFTVGGIIALGGVGVVIIGMAGKTIAPWLSRMARRKRR